MSLLSWWRRNKNVPASAISTHGRYLSYQCAAMQGIGTREQQEDAWTLINATDVTQIRNMGLLAVVADGMGGMSNGTLASSTGIRILSDDFQKMDRTMALEPQLTRSLCRAAEEVHGLLRGSGGSTMVACLLYDEQLCYAGVGDSYLYLLRGDTLVRINREQNVLHQRYLEWIREGAVERSAAEGVHQPQAITGFLGINELRDVDQLCRAMPMKDGDVLLLCSDGVGGVLSPEEVQRCLQLRDANEVAASLKQAVLSKGRRHQDNFTAIVICCKK